MRGPDFSGFDALIKDAGEPAEFSLETLQRFFQRIEEEMNNPPPPRVLIMEWALSKEADLPLGSIQPAALVERRLLHFWKKRSA